jgi:NADPH-dependent curcumin reductase CurA
MPDRNRRLVLAERPTDAIDASTVRLQHVDIPEPGAGEALVHNRYLSIDPTIRTWMDGVVGYPPPIGIDEVVRSGAVAEVVQSNSDRYKVGELVFGLTGWQDYAIADEGARALQALPPGIDPISALSVFGVTGMSREMRLAGRRPRVRRGGELQDR